MKCQPEIADMGTYHYTQDELRELDDPNWQRMPSGLTIHCLICVDCGAQTNDGEPSHIQHHSLCCPGESKRWADFYSREVV